MTALVDTNVLVSRYDARFPDKQAIASRLLRDGLANEALVLPHQALVEFVAATTRTMRDHQILQPMPNTMVSRCSTVKTFSTGDTTGAFGLTIRSPVPAISIDVLT